MRGAAFDDTISHHYPKITSSTAHHLSVVDERFPQSLVITRRRRRGPRSLHAIMRSARTTGSDDRRQPPSGCPGKSGHLPFVQENKVTVLFLNIRGFVSHHIELQAYLRIFGMPIIVGMTQTLLDASTTTIALVGYELVSRLDRRIGFPKSCGIALFVRTEFVDRLVHVADSEIHERSWHILHSDI